MKRKLIIFVVGILTVLFLFTVWPTPWKEYVLRRGDSQIVVRINRATSETYIFNPYSMKWVRENE